MLRFSALFLLCLLPVAGFAVPANVSAMARDMTNAAPLRAPARTRMIFVRVRLYH